MAHLYVVTKASMSYYYILQKGTIKVGSHTSSVAIQFTPVAQFAKRKATHVSYLFQSWLSVREFPYPVPQRLLLLINVGSGFLCLRSSFPPSLSFHLRSCNSTPKKGEAPYLLKYFSNTHTHTHTHLLPLLLPQLLVHLPPVRRKGIFSRSGADSALPRSIVHALQYNL